MVRSWSVRASIGGAAVAALLLAGCGAGNDDAAAPPTSLDSTTAPPGSSSPGAPPTGYVPASLEGPAQNVPKPVMPELAKQETREGAQAFLDYWSDAMWYAYQTGDTSYARDIISPHCEACLTELGEIATSYKNGDWLIGGRPSLELENSSFVEAQDGVYKPMALYSAEGGKLIESKEVSYEVGPSQKEETLVYMDFVDSSWTYITMAPIAGE